MIYLTDTYYNFLQNSLSRSRTHIIPKIKKHKFEWYSLSQFVREYRNLSINGGRQTGKTEAIANFITNNPDVKVIYVPYRLSMYNELKYRLINKSDNHKLPNNITVCDLRRFCGSNMLREYFFKLYVGNDLDYDVVVIFEEPMNSINIENVISKYVESQPTTNKTTTFKRCPLFITIGCS